MSISTQCLVERSKGGPDLAFDLHLDGPEVHIPRRPAIHGTSRKIELKWTALEAIPQDDSESVSEI